MGQNLICCPNCETPRFSYEFFTGLRLNWMFKQVKKGSPLISGIRQKFGNPPEQRATVSPYSNKPGAVQRVAVPSGPDLDYAGSCARKPPSLAVALNCGTGSSFLNALVNAFERLHIVLAANSGY
jgi:hypothetical protein